MTTSKRAPQPTQRITFTDAAIRALPPADKGRGRRHVLADGEPHFLLRITENGTKTFYLNRRPSGSSRPVMVKLCTFRLDRNGRGNLNEARRLAVEKTKDLDAGLNPRVETRKKVKHSFGGAIDAYLRHLHGKGLRHARTIESSLRREFLGQRRRRQRAFGQREWRTEWVQSEPAWKQRELGRVGRAAVRLRLNSIADRNVWAARHALFALSRLFRWLVDQETWGIDHSPVEGLRAAQFGIDKRILRRRRTLSHAELAAVWQAAGTSPVYGTLVRVLMLTGQRLSDFAKAKQSELSEDGGLHLLTVGSERYKNQDPHEVPLTPKVRELLGALPAFAGSDWLFSINGHRPVNNWTRDKARLDKMSGVTGWVLHDLRRTMRTGMGTLRVPRDTAERVIGHKLGELDQVYDLGGHRHAKYEAMLAWETRLLEIVGDTPPPRGLRLVADAATAAA